MKNPPVTRPSAARYRQPSGAPQAIPPGKGSRTGNAPALTLEDLRREFPGWYCFF
jgi:hypothetical protein